MPQFYLAPQVGFEPTTYRLTATKKQRNKGGKQDLTHNLTHHIKHKNHILLLKNNHLFKVVIFYIENLY